MRATRGRQKAKSILGSDRLGATNIVFTCLMPSYCCLFFLLPSSEFRRKEVVVPVAVVVVMVDGAGGDGASAGAGTGRWCGSGGGGGILHGVPSSKFHSQPA